MAKTKTQGTKHEWTVEWILPDKKLIKFVEDKEGSYDIADNVAEYLDKIKDGVVVKTTVDGRKVVFLQVVEKKEEKASTTPSTNDENTKSWTVKAITRKKDVVKFEESDVRWYVIPENVQKYFENVNKGDIITVEIGTAEEKGKEKPAVVFFKGTESEPIKEGKEPTKEPTKSSSKSSYRDEEETTKRTASMNAKDIVVAYISSKAEIVNTEKKVIELVERLTKACYEAIKKL